MSILPNASRVFATRFSSCARSETLHGIGMASPPASRMPAATRSQASCLRLEITTLAPCAASASAIALPMPLVEPVTIATLPCRSNRSFTAILPFEAAQYSGAVRRRATPRCERRSSAAVPAADAPRRRLPARRRARGAPLAIGIESVAAVKAPLTCDGMSSGPSDRCVNSGSFSGTSRSSQLSRSRRALGSAFSWITRLAEVCWIMIVHSPATTPDERTTSCRRSVIS